jgi:hypothetical protein
LPNPKFGTSSGHQIEAAQSPPLHQYRGIEAAQKALELDAYPLSLPTCAMYKSCELDLKPNS